MKTKTYLSWFQVIGLVSSSYLPLTFWIFPRIALQRADVDAHWAVLGVVLLGLFIGLVQGLLNERFPDRTGPDMLIKVFGFWLGKAIVIVYWPVYLFFTGMSLFYFTLVMKVFFPHTPNAVFNVAMCLVAMRGAWHGVEALARVASIIHPLTWLGFVLIFPNVLAEADHFWTPRTVANWPAVFRGIYHLVPLYLGFNLILIITPYYKHKKNRSIWYPVVSAIFAGFVVLLSFMAVYWVVGSESGRRLEFAIPFLIQLIRFHNLPVERVGIFVLVLTTLFTTLFVSNHIYAISALTAKIVNRSEHQYKWFIIPVTLIISTVSLFIHNDEQGFEILEHFMVPMSWVLLLGIPLSVWVTAVLRGLRTEPLPVEQVVEEFRRKQA
jgi:hypothetical protein